MGAAIGKVELPRKTCVPETKLEAKMVEAMQHRAAEGNSLRSFNTIILKFPKIDECLKKCKSIFEQFDEDSNGAIDLEELRHCFDKLEISFTKEDINDLFEACDINNDKGVEFKEFIVLLCLVCLLKDDPAALHTLSSVGMMNSLWFAGSFGSALIQFQKSGMEMPHLETTFQTVADAFVFLDKNKDGYVSKSEMVDAINETSSGERSSGSIAMKRFEEMDWDKNGMVNFKEFLFAFTRWVGIDDTEDDEGDDHSEE